MIKRTLSLIIVLSMIIHCAARLGTLSYLFEKRADIAYSVGLISEIPMSVCSRDYDFSKKLLITQTDTEQSAPASFSLAHEIILFSPAAVLMLPEKNTIHTRSLNTSFLAQHYVRPVTDIFHPPSA